MENQEKQTTAIDSLVEAVQQQKQANEQKTEHKKVEKPWAATVLRFIMRPILHIAIEILGFATKIGVLLFSSLAAVALSMYFIQLAMKMGVQTDSVHMLILLIAVSATAFYTLIVELKKHDNTLKQIINSIHKQIREI